MIVLRVGQRRSGQRLLALGISIPIERVPIFETAEGHRVSRALSRWPWSNIVGFAMISIDIK